MRKHHSVSFAWFYVLIALACAGLLGVRIMLHPVSVSGISMEPTYHDGDILETKTDGYPITYGSVVIIMHDGKRLIKRIAALGGDTVRITDGILYVNGVPEHACFPAIEDPGIASEEIQVPEGFVFLLGDNRNHSKDSRVIGPLPESSIRGVVTKTLVSFKNK